MEVKVLTQLEYEEYIALKKYQHPMRVATEIIKRCPRCGERVDYYKNYCGECGQALDWNNNKEEAR